MRTIRDHNSYILMFINDISYVFHMCFINRQNHLLRLVKCIGKHKCFISCFMFIERNYIQCKCSRFYDIYLLSAFAYGLLPDCGHRSGLVYFVHKLSPPGWFTGSNHRPLIDTVQLLFCKHSIYIPY